MLYNNPLGEEIPGLEIAPEFPAARNQGGVESMGATEIRQHLEALRLSDDEDPETETSSSSGTDQGGLPSHDGPGQTCCFCEVCHDYWRKRNATRRAIAVPVAATEQPVKSRRGRPKSRRNKESVSHPEPPPWARRAIHGELT